MQARFGSPLHRRRLHDDPRADGARPPAVREHDDPRRRHASAEARDDLGNADADGNQDTGLSITGTYAIKFYDAFGEDYQTDPLAATAGCSEIKAALESMANDIVPAGSVICTEIAAGAGVDVNSRNKVEYDLVFTENLGDLKPIEINANLDGTRPSVYAIGHQGADNKVKFGRRRQGPRERRGY